MKTMLIFLIFKLLVLRDCVKQDCETNNIHHCTVIENYALCNCYRGFVQRDTMRYRIAIVVSSGETQCVIELRSWLHPERCNALYNCYRGYVQRDTMRYRRRLLRIVIACNNSIIITAYNNNNRIAIVVTSREMQCFIQLLSWLRPERYKE